ncbi:MAG: Xaa-Pro dipeptidyl-peptidase [Bacteroidetes bacterium]|nr:MAG: Xaa-Pro dipeptidyl-peptidase [Bacteroidota bacterium]
MKAGFLYSILVLSILPKLLFAQGEAKPVFANGEAQRVAAFSDSKTWIREELWVETEFDSDGDGLLDRMHVFVTRPAQTDSGSLKLPVVYSSSPYNGLRLWALMGFGTKKLFWDVDHELGETPPKRKHKNLKTRSKRPFLADYTDNIWLPYGYITVYSSSPGTGLSDGVPTIGGENESLAPKAVIDWLCGRAKGYTTRRGIEERKAFWSTGKVGMTGTSYDGTLCIAAATTGVAGLEAIIPVAPVTSWYAYYRSNGLVRSPGGYLGEDVDVLYDLIHTGDKKKRKRNNRVVRDSLLAMNIDRVTGDYNDFWASRDYLKDIDKMKAAMIMAHGFNDWNVLPEHSYRFYLAAKNKGLPVQLYYHQDDHGGNPPFSMMNRWFTRYLHGVENGVEKDKPVRIVREYSSEPLALDQFPHAKASMVSFYPNAAENNTGTLSLEQTTETKLDTLQDNYRLSAKNLIPVENAKHRLLFMSPVLQKNLHLSGTPKVTLRLSSSKQAANLSVYLVSLPWEEGKHVPVYSNLVNRGWADPQNHRSLTQGEPLKEGEFYDVTFELQPDDQMLFPGQQLGLMIFSSDKEFTLHPEPGTLLYIDLGATRIDLPVVGGKTAVDKAMKKP